MEAAAKGNQTRSRGRSGTVTRRTQDAIVSSEQRWIPEYPNLRKLMASACKIVWLSFRDLMIGSKPLSIVEQRFEAPALNVDR